MSTPRTVVRATALSTLIVSALGLAGCAASPVPDAPTSTSTSRAATDDSRPGELARAFVRSFNQGDARALAALFADDAEFVNIYGIRMSGRSGIEHGHRAAFASRLGGAALTTTRVDEHQVAPDVAVVQLSWRLAKAPDADPTLVVPDSAGVLTFTAVRADAAWQFIAGANVMESTPPS
ncbi:SgcJ/EcaC family oxidoreductase [Microbacterium sp. M1A1_1b]